MTGSKRLWRQLKRSFSLSEPADLTRLLASHDPPAQDGNDGVLSRCFNDFLAKVQQSYEQYERDISLRTRSLDISSAELHDANQRLRAEIRAREQALEQLRQSAAALLAGFAEPPPAELGTLESLSRLIATLVEQRLQLEESLRSSERRFRDLTELSSDWFWEQDAQFRFTMVSGGMIKPLLHPDTIVGKTRQELPIIGVIDAEWRAHQAVLERHEPFEDFRYQVETAPGDIRWFSISGRPLFGEDGEFCGYRGIGQDITDRTRAEDELRLAASVFETTAEAVLVTDAETHILAVNPAFEAITGYGRDEVIGRTPRMLSSGMHDAEFYQCLWAAVARTGHWQGEIWDRRKDGQLWASLTSISAIKDEHGHVRRYVSVFSDVSERKQAEERISHLAQHDFLTGLPNRMLMEDRLAQAIHLAQRMGHSVGLLFIDLDHFKNINDSLGHHVGDLVLQTVAERLGACVRASDTVCRLGGDEFLVVLGTIAAAADAIRVANKILASLADPCAVDGHQLYITPSIGIGIYPEDGRDVASLMKHADAAMYHAKRQGRNSFQFFTQEMNVRASERLELESGLRRALERNEFRLHYQPQVDIRTGRISGVEALVRWQHPEAGMISPARFIPIAEESGLIIPLGEWILRTACHDGRRWQQRGWRVPVAVNISAIQFHHKDFLHGIEQVLSDTGLVPRSLELELTEGVVMKDGDETRERLRQLKRLGVSLAIDDFGTGYSSLSYLKRFPIDKLKVDQSFVRDIVTAHADAEIVRAIIALGRALGLRTIAEGVETIEQLDRLRALGADEYQGYFFQRPQSAEALEPLLAQDAEAREEEEAGHDTANGHRPPWRRPFVPESIIQGGDQQQARR